MDQLFTEEAKRMWEKQEKTWSAEKEARQKLMEDVLKTLSEQTKTKIIPLRPSVLVICKLDTLETYLDD